jgi:hypothetical protein
MRFAAGISNTGTLLNLPLSLPRATIFSSPVRSISPEADDHLKGSWLEMNSAIGERGG